MPRSLIPVVDELSPAALTVLAQTISPTDNGMLRWSLFFPAEPVDSVDLDEVSTLDFRPVSGRRAWNSPGRLITDKTPDLRNISIIPVEGYYIWGEYEMQKLRELQMRAGNAQTLDNIIGNNIPAKVRQITQANWRQVELEAFAAWATGIVTVRNPQTNEAYNVSYGFDSARITTAGTAWDDASVDAYELLINFLEDAIDAVGEIEGVLVTRNIVRAIRADAPDLAGGVQMTLAQLEQRISDDIGKAFYFLPFDDTLEPYVDGGTATAPARVWPAGRIAAIPTGGRVGRTAFAPVTRAMELVSQLPQAQEEIDVRGMTAYYDEAQTGKELKVEVQANPITIPSEQKVFVENTLIA